MQGIEQNPKLGYYKVGEQIFYSKPEAYMYATVHNHWPEWKFNVAEFAKFNWEQEPELDIRELYRIRARQLRDKYEWIRIEASGGSDSTTAIYSFLLNGIHLDEVVFRYPKQLEKGVSGDPFNTKAENTLSEWDFAAKPLLHWIQTNYPSVKITFDDYSNEIITSDYLKDESWVYTTRDWFQPGHGAKHNNIRSIEHRKIADSGKKVCVVYGIDKPKVTLIDNCWYLVFTDVLANHPSPVVGDYTNITTELFYWTPDLPEMVAKQAHMIKNWFDSPGNSHARSIAKWQNQTLSRRTAYEQLAKGIIYPDYDMETWQTSKPTNSFYNEMDHWFYTNMKGTTVYTAWQSGLQMLVDKIDKRYFEYELGRPVGLMKSFSPFYFLGNSIATPNVPAVVNRGYQKQTAGEFLSIKNKKLTTVKF